MRSQTAGSRLRRRGGGVDDTGVRRHLREPSSYRRRAAGCEYLRSVAHPLRPSRGRVCIMLARDPEHRTAGSFDVRFLRRMELST
jgi:hypothetical protein